MIKLTNWDVMNFDNAIRGMRNPLNSWKKNDSVYNEQGDFIFGENDLDLAKRLFNGGEPHRKYLRQIMVCVDITAPLYWWKEFDTYKVGTTANSTSTMHKLTSRPIRMEDLSVDNCNVQAIIAMNDLVMTCNELREKFIETKDKSYWYSLIQLLPSSYNQTRTVTMNYENLANMYKYRKDHKLYEWRGFCKWIESLPYAKDIIIGDKEQEQQGK